MNNTLDTRYGQIQSGTRVVVQGGFGTEPPCTVTVEDVSEDIKNGRPGFIYTQGQLQRWAYTTQIVKILKN